MLRLKVTPVVGLPQFTGWSQVAESTVSVSSRLILVYAISGKHAGNVGRDISEKVSDFYFYDAEQLHDFLQQLVNYAHTNDCKIYFAGAVLGREKSIFATYGGSVFLKRGDKSGRILTSDYEVKIVEGNYIDDDVFVLTTLQADQFLSEIQLKFQQGYDVDIIITSVVPGLHAQEDSSLSAIVFVSKDDESTEDSDQIDDEESPFLEIEGEVGSKNEGKLLSDIPLVDSEQNINSDNMEQQSLAKVSVEADKIEVPGFVSKAGIFGKSAMVLAFSKLQFFLKWLLGIIKRFLIWFWNKITGFDLSRFQENISVFRRDGIKALLVKRTMYLSESRPKKGVIKSAYHKQQT